MLKVGSVVDATLIQSTFNDEQRRDAVTRTCLRRRKAVTGTSERERSMRLKCPHLASQLRSACAKTLPVHGSSVLNAAVARRPDAVARRAVTVASASDGSPDIRLSPTTFTFGL